MEHLDEEWENRNLDVPLLKEIPSEYMQSGRVFVSCEPEEKALPAVAESLGDGNILFASDYSHWDGKFPELVSKLADRSDVSDSLTRKIFFDNSCRYYILELDKSPV